jgi:hypothetical protein
LTEPHWNEIRRQDDFNQDSYWIDIEQLPSGEWYWHLYFRDEKVNGGLSPDKTWAQSDAKTARHSHSRNEWCKGHVWDVETQSWITRSQRGLA